MKSGTLARLDAIAQELTTILAENMAERGSFCWESLYNARLAVEQVGTLLATPVKEAADG